MCVLEANFVEPTHDKQSFERTTEQLNNCTGLRQRLVVKQKSYCWEMEISVAAMDSELRTMRGNEEIRKP
ncbi:unnamed protein product [Camellia sinensis]